MAKKKAKKKRSTKKSKRTTQKQLIEQIAVDIKEIKERLTVVEEAEDREIMDGEELADTEKDQLEEMRRLEELEEAIAKDVAPHPLARITYRDITKGIIGAFFGIVGHFAFFYGEKLAHDITAGRATALLGTSLVLLVMFIYFSGYRVIKKDYEHHYVLWRVLVIFFVAHAVIAFVLFLFGRLELGMSWVEIYKNIAAVSILAVMGSATADLIGGE